jgi:hypothetical protein
MKGQNMSKRKKNKKRSAAAATKRRAEKHKSGFINTAYEVPDGTKEFALKSDRAVRLDVIPYEVGQGNPYADKGELHYERTYFVHRSIGADQTSYVCLRKTNNESCPICDYRSKLAKDPDADEDLIRDLAPKERQLFNVIDTKDRDKGVQVWDMSFHLFGKRLDQELKNSDEDDNYDDFHELEGGLTLKLGIEEKSFGGRGFFEVVSVNFKPRNEDYDEDILDEATCLDDILIIKDYDELKEIFLQTAGDDDDDEDDDKKKSKKSKKDKDKKSKKDKDKKSKKDDDDDTEDDDTEDDDTEDDDGDEPEWEKGDRVIINIDGEDYAGKIKSIDDGDETATVKCDDGDIVSDVEFDDLKPEPEKDKKKSSKKDKDKKGKKDKGKKDKKGKKGKKECPGDGTFGKDTDELPDCNDCPHWDECDDA